MVWPLLARSTLIPWVKTSHPRIIGIFSWRGRKPTLIFCRRLLAKSCLETSIGTIRASPSCSVHSAIVGKDLASGLL